MKTLAVVCDEKTHTYGTYLSQLIGQNDDDGDTIVGTKDGDVSIRIISEQQYRNAKIASGQHVLFIGTGDLAKEHYQHMKVQYNKYGMKYAWLGHECALYVDEIVARKEYSSFLEYARTFQSDVNSVRDSLATQVAKAAGVGVGTAGGAAIAGICSAAIFTPIAAMAAGGAFLGKRLIRNKKEKKAIADQQYCCLVLYYYLNGINTFLNQ